MLLIWTTPSRWEEPSRPSHHQTHRIAKADDPELLGRLLDRIEAAARARTPLGITLYAGHHYHDTPAHWRGINYVRARHSDRPRPELALALGGDATPLHWTSADGRSYTSQGADGNDEPELRYLDRGEETSAPAWSLISAGRAREALWDFHRTGGRQPGDLTWQRS
jgi:Immunity protein Imm1